MLPLTGWPLGMIYVTVRSSFHERGLKAIYILSPFMAGMPNQLAATSGQIHGTEIVNSTHVAIMAEDSTCCKVGCRFCIGIGID